MDRRDTAEAETLYAVQQTLQGDASAFALVVSTYSRAMFSLARNYGRSTEDAEDDVQEIFLTAYRSLAKFDLSRRFSPWLFQIAVNHLRSARRKNVRRILRAEVVSTDQQALDEIAVDRTQRPEHEAIERIANEDVARALRSLPPKQRDAFVLRQMQGLSGSEAARILEIPEETLRTHLFRARKAIRKFVSDRGWS
jgi:RNA polymerase sigma-70 factor (ECF subfamily)